MILCLFPWGEGVGGSVCCDRGRGAGEDEQAGGVEGGRAVGIYQDMAGLQKLHRGLLAIKDRNLSLLFFLVANNFSALALITKNKKPAVFTS